MIKVKKKIHVADDFIFIEDLIISCKVGCTKKERSFPQIIHLDLTLHLSLEKAGNSDDLNDSIDYADVVNRTRTILDKKSFNLLEQIATVVANDLLKRKPIRAVGVRVSKPVLIGVGNTGVSIWREK